MRTPDTSPRIPYLTGHSTRWLLIALTLFLLQVLPLLSHRWVTDESWYAGPGVTLSQGLSASDPGMGLNEDEHRFDARPPGTATLMAASFKLFGTSEITARLGSVLAGVAILFLLYGLARDVFGEEAAILCALLAATDNFLVITSRTARPEALTAMAILLGLWALKRYAQSGSIAWAACCGLLMALGTMFHVTLLGYIVAYGVLMIALDWRAKRFPLRGALPYTAGYFIGLLPYVAWITHQPNQAGISSFKEEFIGKAKSDTLWVKLMKEFARYNDYFGVGMLHTHGLAALPVRLPIALAFFAATYVLWRYRRSWFYVELLLLVPSMLWLVYTANKSSRYLAIVAPVTVLVLGAAVSLLRSRPRAFRWAVAIVALVVVAQTGANLLLLNSARKADYRKAEAQLRNLIPQGQTAYGTITFWFGLRDSPYIASERTDPLQARAYGAKYFIGGDRLMAMGSPLDSAYFEGLRAHFKQATADGTLVGEIHDPYYGDLKVYRVP